ncbi:undecaprenyldiphospho-muramoylpentapeptide beta-N-acetylglucosaminyltransferase [Mariprofundus erugo]|uniref:UDP-N-acetylglucosamine--N-acetylmuramyl-(pentapeptide) pyrophosphoryl-undecaprenol N-acetylglucosamine transferase n=2 Tax=Mariprofundus erugo TaxID=2528639 RepID=A0A5R9GZI5_9PROT|nr:undecaprenyldiphospho-muramoylpentapeptide beta-N-acetylglucosaminyltransferase [Mariprofundus erugo]
MKRMPRLCIAGGGTGGHVMPALALADAARERWPELEVSFIGAERGLEARLLPERGESVLLLKMHGIKGAGWLQRLRVLLWELPRSVMTIRRSWQESRPDLLVGVGGYASISGVAAALLARIPVVLYEQNAMPGLVNRTLGRFCKRVMLGFAAAGSHIGSGVHTVVTGNIVRQAIMRTQWQAHQPPRLLVLGGSQGARVLNQTVPEACMMLAREGRVFTVTHIAGKDEAAITAAKACYDEAGITADVLPFCDDMPSFYRGGDLMVARSGAMTVSEAAVSGMPCLFVPLPHAADDHQRHNALALAGSGGAMVLEQTQLTGEALAAAIEACLFDPARLAAMSRSTLAAAPVDARDRQLDVLAEFLPLNDSGEVCA